jgi:hypothetical protein
MQIVGLMPLVRQIPHHKRMIKLNTPFRKSPLVVINPERIASFMANPAWGGLFVETSTTLTFSCFSGRGDCDI